MIPCEAKLGRTWRRFGKGLAYTSWIWAALSVVMSGCNCAPARSKSWRHAPDPADVAAKMPPNSEVLRVNLDLADTKRSHTLRIHVDSRVRRLDPFAPSTWTTRIAFDTVFESLIRYDPQSAEYSPALAQSWVVSPDGKEIQIVLRQGVLFHDGKSVTASDVQFSLDRARLKGAVQFRNQLRDVVGIDVIDDTHIKVRLARSNGFVLRALAAVPIVPQQHYAGRPRSRQLAKNRRLPVIGSGPYRVAGWTDRVIRLSLFDEYWDHPAKIPDIVFVYEPDAARALMLAKGDRIDWLPSLIPSHYGIQTSISDVARRFVILPLVPPKLRYLVFNTQRVPFRNRGVREAVSWIVDSAGLVQPGESRAASGFAWIGGMANARSAKTIPYRLEKSARLLDLAGWTSAGKSESGRYKLRERGGHPLRVEFLTAKTKAPMYKHIARNLRRAGFQVAPLKGPSGVLGNRMKAGRFDIGIVEYQGYPDQDLSLLFHSEGTKNYGQFFHLGVDRLLDQILATWSPSDRRVAFRKLDHLLRRQWPMVAITASDPRGMLHKRVRGAQVRDGWVVLRNLTLEEPTDVPQ